MFMLNNGGMTGLVDNVSNCDYFFNKHTSKSNFRFLSQLFYTKDIITANFSNTI